MNFIAVVDQNWGIGKDGDLLFHLPPDMKHFKQTTMGKVVVMGKATLQSLPQGKPLAGRTNIVLSTNMQFFCDGAHMCRSTDELFDVLKQYDTRDVFVIGGASVYNRLMDCCDTAYITKVETATDADTHIHPLDGRDGWSIKEAGEPQQFDGLTYSFHIYTNTNVKHNC